MRIVNLAGYLFVSIPDPTAWRAPLRERCESLQLRGTILLSPEGINLFIAGAPEQTDALLAFLRDDPLFEGRLTALTVKTSHSDEQPFKRMLVKLKREIITMRHPTIRPEAGRAPSVSPATLQEWLDRGHDDDGRPVVLLDTRNGFEIDHGTFDGAIDWRLDKFGDFPDAVAAHRDSFDGKTVVSFCTGGIRCEKAAIHMANTGISNVYQLEGGILGYFEHVGGAHYNGACFVFDEREALTPTLQPTAGTAEASPEPGAASAKGAATGSPAQVATATPATSLSSAIDR